MWLYPCFGQRIELESNTCQSIAISVLSFAKVAPLLRQSNLDPLPQWPIATPYYQRLRSRQVSVLSVKGSDLAHGLDHWF